MRKKKIILDLEDFKIEKLHSMQVSGGGDCFDCGGVAAEDCTAATKAWCKETGTGTLGMLPPVG